jgi:hypothetical protein
VPVVVVLVVVAGGCPVSPVVAVPAGVVALAPLAGAIVPGAPLSATATPTDEP